MPIGPPTRLRHWTVTTADGVPIDTVMWQRRDTRRDTAIVMAHGFTGTWRSPDIRRLARFLDHRGDVMAFDFRGHKSSGGVSTIGDREVLDLDAVVRHARGLGYTRVATIGFSLGAAVAIRHAALFGGVDAAVAVSTPSRWYYRGTRAMRVLHWGAEHDLGRLVLRVFRDVRVTTVPWDPVPPSPLEVVARVAPAPLLLVHGDIDHYFPLEHAYRLYEAAREPKELWVERGLRHAEAAIGNDLIGRVAGWLDRALPEAAESAPVAAEARVEPPDAPEPAAEAPAS
ncbi:alpha/beta hydrolase [Allonocardiopsis opalescens]|uniref:alpha/beta hydrolase n=1 Tax=Allonocardiopsis opalescens TaxID=1144618 RepID=UPI001FE4745B|nr:alpha/beta fold hydrolase [Allonocardiopsis opalescens]